MIKLENIDSRTCPLIICDECGERIQSFQDGVVVWNDAQQFRHIHKIRCDAPPRYPYWCGLGEHLRNLLFNVGMGTPEMEAEN
jgi:hypothetical protein